MIYSQKDVEEFRFAMGILALTTMAIAALVFVEHWSYSGLAYVLPAFVAAAVLFLSAQFVLPRGYLVPLKMAKRDGPPGRLQVWQPPPP
jgi:hypothetical protein